MEQSSIEVFYPQNTLAFRNWLQENHISKQAVWIVFHKKASKKETLSWSEAVDVALCFGWIDSKKIKINDDTSHQFFSKRKAKSTWSKINKEKIDKLIAEGLMTDAGYKSIEVAKENGSWTILDSVEELIIPADLEEAFNIHEGAKDYFLSLSKSSKKMLLHWVVLAKLPLTRQKRIDEIALQAGKQQKPKNF
ncbi:MAG: YdeI/OmpD-associated family protein [Flavobacterium sp.]